MNEDAPTRLREQPEFLALSGLRFEDEAATADVLDVEAGRAALEVTVSSGATSVMGPQEWLATTAAKAGVGLVMTATIASITFLSVGQSDPPPEERRPAVTAPVIAEAPSPRAIDPPAATAVMPPAALEEVKEVDPIEAPSLEEPVVKAAASKASPPRRRPTPTKERAVTSPEPVEATVRNPQPASTLPEQLALYEAGKKALAAGGYSAALKAFEAYRATFPAGTLRREVGLSMLEALVRSGKVARASRLAKRLLASGGLGARLVEVRRVLGEMQARLGRCDDAALTFATVLQEGGSGLTLTAVEAAVARCRNRQEASP